MFSTTRIEVLERTERIFENFIPAEATIFFHPSFQLERLDSMKGAREKMENERKS